MSSAPSMSLPVSAVSSPAPPAPLQALQGRTGTVSGPDYRSVEVIAVYNFIPDLELGLVMKADQTEIQAPAIAAALKLLLISVIAVVVCVLLLTFVVKRMLDSSEQKWAGGEGGCGVREGAVQKAAAGAPFTRHGGAMVQLVSPSPRDAVEGKGPQRRPQRRSDRRLVEIPKAVGGGYMRLQMPLKPALDVSQTVAGHRQGVLEGGGGGGYLPPFPFQCIPAQPPMPRWEACSPEEGHSSQGRGDTETLGGIRRGPACGLRPPLLVAHSNAAAAVARAAGHSRTPQGQQQGAVHRGSIGLARGARRVGGDPKERVPTRGECTPAQGHRLVTKTPRSSSDKHNCEVCF